VVRWGLAEDVACISVEQTEAVPSMRVRISTWGIALTSVTSVMLAGSRFMAGPPEPSGAPGEQAT